MVACHTLLIALFLPLPLLLFAQQDVQLSPQEPVSYALPSDIRIQSAAQFGNTTLVVWGTTGYAADSSIVNVLRLQLLRDSSLVGQQRALHGSQARPSGFVRVVALNDRYLVFWNDQRKSASG